MAEGLWSLKAFDVQRVPAVKGTEWPRSRVDQFVLARLEKEGLVPNEEAEPLTLLRRVYFDLIGLPPPLEVVEGFHISKLPAVVDGLLASPEFG